MEKSRIPWYQRILHQGILTNDILIYKYAGNGTIHDPYRVTFLDNDPGDPLQFKSWIRWTLCLIVGFVTLSVTFASSAYASAVPEITSEMGGSDVINTLGVSLFVIGFIFGPFLWAPTSGEYLTILYTIPTLYSILYANTILYIRTLWPTSHLHHL